MLVFFYDSFQTLAVFVLACRLRQLLALEPTPMLQLLRSQTGSPVIILATASARLPAPKLTGYCICGTGVPVTTGNLEWG